ncbi:MULTISPECIES: DUF4129 domain-containing protein [Streptomyces]|uniref:DUF4129 domain-containing protein n=1 Tax=Streptomyces TaxID=1883 RepID=UPI000CD54003|nr:MULTISPECIES: DUF4129 domain-containing protein [Streptomyces]
MTGAVAAALTAADEPPVDIGRDPAREAARRELSREIYTEHRPGIARRAFDWLWEQLGKLLDVALSPPGGWVGLLIIVLVVVALLVALRLRLGTLRSAAGPRRAPLDGDVVLSAAEHRAAADRHAAAGRWREAVQERMRALVRSLEERTLLDPRPGRTADEAATEAGAALPELAGRVRSAARLFDAVTYGGAPAGEDDHSRLRELDETVRRARPRHPVDGTETAPTSGAAR